MGSDQLACPGCGGNLAMGQVQGFRQYVCPLCGGVVVGIAVLRQLSGEAGQHIWTAEPCAGTMAAAICPFCRAKMTPKALATGNAATCRACEVVWLDKQAASSSRCGKRTHRAKEPSRRNRKRPAASSAALPSFIRGTSDANTAAPPCTPRLRWWCCVKVPPVARALMCGTGWGTGGRAG